MEMYQNQIEEILKSVIDPEIGLNIIDLGLIYDVRYLEGDTIVISMTLTTRNCPMSEILPQTVEEVLRLNFPHANVLVELVWEPNWTPDRISEKGRVFLGL